jgi:cell division protein FtsW
MEIKKVDRFLLINILIIAILGIVFFVSSSLGILVKDKSLFYSALFNQLVVGFVVGILGMFVALKIPYKFWRNNAFYIFLGSILLTALVFVPGLGMNHGGATRWISLGFLSFQPAEILKFSFIIYLATWFSWAKHKIHDFKFGILPLALMFAVVGGVLLLQPDTKSFLLILATGLSMYFLSGVSLKKIAIIGGSLTIFLALLVATTPYLQKRIQTFLNPAHDAKNSSYQIQQSFIAIGSGGLFGRGLGQSIQKFTYLPEAQGDSIFAVVAEEVGFVGSVIVILVYLSFALRGMRIANKSPDSFSRLLVSGIVILFIMQSFMNIASITGLFPLTGVPLVFMSRGGTSIAMFMFAMGIVLQISKYQKHREN